MLIHTSNSKQGAVSTFVRKRACLPFFTLILGEEASAESSRRKVDAVLIQTRTHELVTPPCRNVVPYQYLTQVSKTNNNDSVTIVCKV